MPSHDRLVAHLVERGILGPEAVVDGELRVVDASRRHRNAQVRAGSSYLVKDGGDEGDALGTVAYEAAVYDRLAGLGPAVGAHVPRSFGYDAAARILVTELVVGAENAREHAMRTAGAAPAIARAIGDALGCLHAAAAERGTAGFGGALSRQPPDVFALAHPTLRILHNVSSGTAGLMRIVQQTPALADGLDALVAAWRPAMLIHGDPRWENWLVAAAADPPQVKLVDWEFAGVGDPAWDAGSVVCEYLAFWLRSTPFIPGTTIDQAVGHSDVSLEDVQHGIRAFWLAYVRRSRPSELDEELMLVSRFTAAKLVQFAAEQAHSESEVSAATGALLQLAANVFADPERAAHELLGIPSIAAVAA
jgi:aminoglycoside phosphotransferase (APT) family kinase protein